MSDAPLPSSAWPRRLWRNWALRSTLVGGASTVMDTALGWTLVTLGAPTRAGAMTGVLFGGTFTFFANRYFSFREKDAKLGAPAVRYALVFAMEMLVHGQVVVLLRDRAGLHYVAAKLCADLAIFSVLHLLLMRYVVFPRRAAPTDQAPPTASSGG